LIFILFVLYKKRLFSILNEGVVCTCTKLRIILNHTN